MNKLTAATDKILLPAETVTTKPKANKYTTSMLNDNTCDHRDQQNFYQQELPGFFKNAYFLKHEFAPKQCGVCTVSFGEEYKVGTRNPVYACTNANNTNHACVYALCKECFKSWVLNVNGNDANGNSTHNSGKRTRRGTIKTVE